jgi:hypothetical protein
LAYGCRLCGNPHDATYLCEPGSWALKGGIAMIARVGERARATSDADATWRADEQSRSLPGSAAAGGE